MTFPEKILQFIKPGYRVLDLGAGEGLFAHEALLRDAHVTAVDINAAPERFQEVDWKQEDARNFIEHLPESERFDVIYSRNLIQFLDSGWVVGHFFQTLVNHLRPGGILAIQTFFRDPEPPFERPVNSLYSLEQLRAAANRLDILEGKQFVLKATDMKGIPRTFYLINLIGQKSPTAQQRGDKSP